MLRDSIDDNCVLDGDTASPSSHGNTIHLRTDPQTPNPWRVFQVSHEPYVVESREAFGPLDWNVLVELAPASVAGFAEVTDTVTGTGRFYRVRPSF